MIKAIRVSQHNYVLTVDHIEGRVQHLMVDGECLVYRVFAALRDTAWGTPRPLVKVVENSRERIILSSDYNQSGYGLAATTSLLISQCSLRVEYKAVISSSLLRNRLGLCLLLPATLAGTAVRVYDPGGKATDGRLPVEIAPHQPFTAITGLDLQGKGHLAEFRFEGDLFEMEDQRNWTDYSCKIYSTPLELPFPVRLSAGSTVEQAVSINIRQAPHAFSVPWIVPATVEASLKALPLLGTRIMTGESLPDGVPLDFIRLDLHQNESTGGTPNGPNDGSGSRENCYGGGALCHPVSKGLRGGQSIEVVDGAEETRDPELPVHLYHWHSPDTNPYRPLPLDGNLLSVLSSQDLTPRVRYYGTADTLSATVSPHNGVSGAAPLFGTDGAFAELNRSRPPAPVNGLLSFSVSPQVHDFDDEAVMDNLFGLRDVLESARRLYPETPISLGLAELTPHFNPASGDYAQNARARRIDPRLNEIFALAWAFAVFCEAAAAGVYSICFFDAAGPHGLGHENRLVPAVRLFHDIRTLRAAAGRLHVCLPAAAFAEERCYSLTGGGFSITACLDIHTRRWDYNFTAIQAGANHDQQEVK